MSNVLSDDKKKQVIALGQLGWSLRRIEKATGVRWETATGYLKVAGVPVRPPGGWGKLPPAKPANNPTTDSSPNSKPANEVTTDFGADSSVANVEAQHPPGPARGRSGKVDSAKRRGAYRIILRKFPEGGLVEIFALLIKSKDTYR